MEFSGLQLEDLGYPFAAGAFLFALNLVFRGDSRFVGWQRHLACGKTEGQVYSSYSYLVAAGVCLCKLCASYRICFLRLLIRFDLFDLKISCCFGYLGRA